jgi:sporulation protein YqfC
MGGLGVKDWREAVAERLDVPAEAAGSVKVTLSGRRSVLVENHRGLLAYARECVEIGGGTVRVRIRGEDLSLSAMDGEAMRITGTVFAVELE